MSPAVVFAVAPVMVSAPAERSFWFCSAPAAALRVSAPSIFRSPRFWFAGSPCVVTLPPSVSGPFASSDTRSSVPPATGTVMPVAPSSVRAVFEIRSVFANVRLPPFERRAETHLVDVRVGEVGAGRQVGRSERRVLGQAEVLRRHPRAIRIVAGAREPRAARPIDDDRRARCGARSRPRAQVDAVGGEGRPRSGCRRRSRRRPSGRSRRSPSVNRVRRCVDRDGVVDQQIAAALRDEPVERERRIAQIDRGSREDEPSVRVLVRLRGVEADRSRRTTRAGIPCCRPSRCRTGSCSAARRSTGWRPGRARRAPGAAVPSKLVNRAVGSTLMTAVVPAPLPSALAGPSPATSRIRVAPQRPLVVEIAHAARARLDADAPDRRACRCAITSKSASSRPGVVSLNESTSKTSRCAESARSGRRTARGRCPSRPSSALCAKVIPDVVLRLSVEPATPPTKRPGAKRLFVVCSSIARSCSSENVGCGLLGPSGIVRRGQLEAEVVAELDGPVVRARVVADADRADRDQVRGHLDVAAGCAPVSDAVGPEPDVDELARGHVAAEPDGRSPRVVIESDRRSAPPASDQRAGVDVEVDVLDHRAGEIVRVLELGHFADRVLHGHRAAADRDVVGRRASPDLRARCCGCARRWCCSSRPRSR